MGRQDVERKIYALIMHLCDEKPQGGFKPDTCLRECLSSLDVVEIFMEIEHIYKISINDKDIVKCKTVEDMVNTVCSYLSSTYRIFVGEKTN